VVLFTPQLCARGVSTAWSRIQPQHSAHNTQPQYHRTLPASQLQAGIGLRRHIEPSGKVPSLTCMAGMVYEASGREWLSRRRMTW